MSMLYTEPVAEKCRYCGATSTFITEHRTAAGNKVYGTCDTHRPKHSGTASRMVSIHVYRAVGAASMALRDITNERCERGLRRLRRYVRNREWM